jgi:hypothetical protein
VVEGYNVSEVFATSIFRSEKCKRRRSEDKYSKFLRKFRNVLPDYTAPEQNKCNCSIVSVI